MPFIPLVRRGGGGTVVIPNPVASTTYRAVRFAYDNLITVRPGSVAITTSSEAFGFPVQNLASKAVWQKWRSETGNASEWVKANFGVPRAISAMMLKNGQGYTAGRIRLQ